MPRAAGKEWVASSARRTRLVFKALGFTVACKGKDIEEGIALYEQGGMDGKGGRVLLFLFFLLFLADLTAQAFVPG
jgi:hypothetical protein